MLPCLTSIPIPIYHTDMKTPMKQVAVRMSDELHLAALKMAKREQISFGELVRKAVNNHIDILKNWVPVKTGGRNV